MCIWLLEKGSEIMSLKGYQWLDSNKEVAMSYHFKDLSLNVWKDVTREELNKFIEYLKQNGCDRYILNTHNSKIIESE